MQPVSVDLGSVNSGPTSALNRGGMSLTQGSTWRTLMRQARYHMGRGEDPLMALASQRPCFMEHNQFTANATLRKDEWILFDDAVQAAYLEELVAVQDLLGRGLRLNLGNPFGTIHIEHERVSEMTEAQVSMYAGTPPENDRVEYSLVGYPVPIVSKGFWLDERTLEASRMRGSTLDTTNADAATRVVSEKLEDLLFNGGPTHGGYTLYGYTTHPNRNTGSLTAAWSTLAASNPSTIIANVNSMLSAVRTDQIRGPFILYIPDVWEVSLNNDYVYVVGTPTDYSAGPTRTIRERILQNPQIADIKASSRLTNEVVLVDMARRTVDVAFGFEPRLIQWESQGGLVNHFRVLSIMSFRCKADFAGRCGIAHYSV